MSLRIRRAVLESDRAEMTELFRRYLSPQADSRRFDWLYRGGPHGVARAWVACESATGAMVGAAAAFPRKMYFGGVERTGWVLGDFCLEQSYRSLGPALQLQRACLDAAGEAPSGFCYDFPSSRMMAVYNRLGISQSGTLVRWAKPLRLERHLQPRLRSRPLARALSAIGNAVLAYQGRSGDAHCCELALHSGLCGEEFDALDRKMRELPGVRTARTAQYLNWCYLSNPQATHGILTARRAGTLIGYAVFTQQGEEAHIADLCSVEEPAVIVRLLSGAVELLRKRGVATVSMNAGDCHPWSAVFEQAAFRKREASPIVVYSVGGDSAFGALAPTEWYLMHGERDN